MQLPHDAVLLRIFFGEQDRFAGRPLYDAIVRKAREVHLAGATVLRGPMGYGRASRVHRANLFELSEDLPMVIEIVDGQEKIDAFLPLLETMMGSGLVTMEKVKVIRYGDGPAALAAASP
jgi:PII-like signaling protein